MMGFTRLRLSNKLALPVGIAGLVIIAGVLLLLARMRADAVEQSGISTGRALASQVLALRAFYTTEIATRARKAGMQLDHTFAERENTLPLPATLVKTLGESIARQYPGTNVKLLSDFSFPHRAAEAGLDAFQREALAALRKDPRSAQHLVQTVDGKPSIRYAVADVMQEGCVSCHNGHPESPRRDWKVGDVRGLVEVTVPLGELDADLGGAIRGVGGLIVFGVVALVAVILLLARVFLVRPLQQASATMKQLADGDLSVRPDGGGGDEVGELLSAMRELADRLSSTIARVRSGVDSVAIASREIAQGNQDLSSRTEQQASSLQQTAASMEQMTGTVRHNADTASQASQLASAASEVAGRGGTVVAQVVSRMGEISAASRKIEEIITVIDGIAFQTNILALNAAVEAARAGEQGRGFAVVAGEVRNLAQRSAQAAREIKGLIADSVAKVESGGKLVDEAGQTMGEIVAQVKRVTDLIGEITSATLEQSSGIGQVNQAVTQLDQMTQQNAALVEQSAAAAQSLKDQADRLAQAVAMFKVSQGQARQVISNAQQTAARAAPAAPQSGVPAAAQPPSTAAPSPAPVKLPPAKPAAKNDDDWEEF
jgi:methyl-accepting chemotaxis protein